MAQAPKKEKKEKKHKVDKQYLGKLEKNQCRIGIVGLPNVGKSSLFNTFSAKQVAAENYPFCTIKPAQAQVAVQDKRFDHLVNIFKPKSEVHAILEVWDIAGLVQGAHEGKGLGNEFLSNIQAVDAIYHVVRAFKAKHIEHVEGSVDPVRDLEIISYELRAKDLAFMEKKEEAMEKLSKRSADRRVKADYEVIKLVHECLKAGKDVAFEHWTGDQIEVIRGLHLFTAKPVVFLVNVSEKNWLSGSNKWMPDIKTWVDKRYPGAHIVPFSAQFEAKLLELEPAKQEAYLKEHKTKTMVSKIIHAGYKELQLIHFFTCGADEVKCWTIRKGTKCPQAAGTIHSDMEHGFICGETYAYKDFKKLGSEHAVKAAGKYHQNGRNYVVEDGDILFFKFNKPQKQKK